MRTAKSFRNFLSLLAILAAGASVAPAQATEFACVHGNAGAVEDLNNLVDPLGKIHRGDGLRADVLPGSQAWLQFPVPTTFGEQQRFVIIYYSTFSDSRITQVDVWNGHERVQEFTGLDWSSPVSVATGALQLDMADNLHSLNLSVLTDGGPAGGYVKIHRLCAYAPN